MKFNLISINEVCDRTSLSRTTLWRMTRAGDFPAPITITGMRKAFVAAEIDDWIASRISARDAETRH